VSAEAIRSAILDLRRRGVTIILSTHDMHLAESLCDYILMIFRGRKVLDGTLTSIQDQYGEDTIRVTADGGVAAVESLPGVEQIRDLGQVQELRLTRGADPQEALRALVAKARVTSFSLTKPSLYDIFMRIAGPAAEEANHASA
jgi:ABC-2 type transport system ATP-binding protein